MSCNISVPIEDIAESVAQMLRQQFIEKDGGTGTGNTLTDTVLRGGLTFDATAKQAICDAIERCVASQIAESQAEQDADIEDKINAGDDRLEDKINGFEDRIDAGRIVGVTREDDTVTVKLANGNEFPFSITDSSSGGDRPVQFAPSADGENVEITLADGSVLDMTRQEFADWLAGDESPLTTDEELEALANDIANNTGDLQSQIDALNDKFKSINYDQATLSIVDDKLRVTNEDGTFSEKPLAELLKLSPDDGNLLEVRDNGLYYGIEAPPNLANIYVDAELGDDSLSPEDGGGSSANPFKTLGHALRLSPNDKSNTIHLKATLSDEVTPQRYFVGEEGRGTVVTGTAKRVIRAYGQPIFNSDMYSCFKKYILYPHLQVSVDYIRPVVTIDWRKDVVLGEDRQRRNYLRISGGGSILFVGIELDMINSQFNKSEYRPYEDLGIIGDGLVDFYGCVITDYEDSRAVIFDTNEGQVLRLNFKQTNLVGERTTGVPLISLHQSSGVITVSKSSSGLNEKTAECVPEGIDASTQASNMVEVLTRPNAITGVVRHSTGVPLNLTSNFNI